MSRVVNVSASTTEVTAACATMKLDFSVIEALAGGGTRVVLKSAAAADNVRAHYKKKVLATDMARVPTRLMKQ